MCRGRSYQREFWAGTTAGIISTSAAALFIKPTSTEEKSSKQNTLFIAQDWIFADIPSRHFIALHKFLICARCQECQKTGTPRIKEEIKPILLTSEIYWWCGSFRFIPIETSVRLSRKLQIQSRNSRPRLPFLNMKSSAADKTRHMDHIPELASKINIQLMINRWVKIMMLKPESVRPY